MNKIGIFTLQDDDNFGNRLQNYALQKVLKKLQCEVYSFKNYRRTNFSNSYFKNRLLLFLLKLKIKISHLKKYKRYILFKKFNKYIQFYEKDITYCNYKKEFEKFDYIIVGSDQVWNYDMLRLSEIDLLKNISPNKRISYAASIGLNTLNAEAKKKFQKELSNFKGISVRETTAKDMLDKLYINKNILVNVDPTLLLSKTEWNKLSCKSLKRVNFKYVLCYFLGEISDNLNKKINEFCIDNQCNIINLLDRKSSYYNCGPSEFLYLVEHANLIITDSFHCCVFSIIFDKPFIVCNRKDKLMNISSRIDNLLKLTNLENRKYNDKISLQNYIKINCQNAKKIIEQEKIKSLNYLKKMIGVNYNER